MKMKFLPTTKLGKWAVGFDVLFFIILILVTIIASIYPPVDDDNFFDNLQIGIPMVIAFVSVITGAIIGLIATIKKADRSILVYFSIIFGFMLLLMLLAELVFPH